MASKRRRRASDEPPPNDPFGRVRFNNLNPPKGAPIRIDTTVTAGTTEGGTVQHPSAPIPAGSSGDLFSDLVPLSPGVIMVTVNIFHVGSHLLPQPWNPIPALPQGATCILEVTINCYPSGANFYLVATYSYDNLATGQATSQTF